MKRKICVLFSLVFAIAACFAFAACAEKDKTGDKTGETPTAEKARRIEITVAALADKVNDGTPLKLSGDQYRIVQGDETIAGNGLTADNGAIVFEYKAKTRTNILPRSRPKTANTLSASESHEARTAAGRRPFRRVNRSISSHPFIAPQ